MQRYIPHVQYGIVYAIPSVSVDHLPGLDSTLVPSSKQAERTSHTNTAHQGSLPSSSWADPFSLLLGSNGPDIPEGKRLCLFLSSFRCPRGHCYYLGSCKVQRRLRDTFQSRHM